jgi:hypothetical protein
MDGTGDHYVEGDKLSSKSKMSHVFTHFWDVDLRIIMGH